MNYLALNIKSTYWAQGRRLFGAFFLLSLGLRQGLGQSSPATVTVGGNLQLFIDQSLIASTAGAQLVQHAPHSGGYALKSEKPWEGDTLYISSIFRYQGQYRMLYRGVDKRTDSETYHLCLATSRDGITWERPSLGLIDFDGSRDNNIVADGNGNRLANCFTFYDPRAETPADQRVKAFVWSDGKRYYHYSANRPERQLIVLGSADGRVFRDFGFKSNLASQRINAFDGGSIFWSSAEQTFIGYFRWWDEKPAPHARLLGDWMFPRAGVRSVFRSTSKDLVNWTEEIPMSYGDTPREHFYETGTFPYFRAPQLYVALANRFNPGRRALTLAEEHALKVRSVPDSHGVRRLTFTSDANDLILLLAKPGGSVYARPFLEAFMRPGDNLGNWSSRSNYPPQHGGLWATSATEMSFLVTRQHFQPANHIERMILRIDGFASMKAPYAGGEFITVPLIYTGDHLELNFSTSGAGEIRVEVQDASGKALPGLALDDCDPVIGDRIAGRVSWRGRESLSGYVGLPVRLRIKLFDADVYSFRFGAISDLGLGSK